MTHPSTHESTAYEEATRRIDRFTIEETLHESEGAGLYYARDERRKGGPFILKVLRYSSEDDALVAYGEAKTWQNLLSLNYHPAFLNPLEIIQSGESLVILHEGLKGVHLPGYLREFFKGYQADEPFAFELAWHLVEIACSLASQGGGAFAIGEIPVEHIFFTEEGRPKFLPPSMERDAGSRGLLKGFAHLLFIMLTCESPIDKGEFLTRSRDVNGEISEEAEAIIRRCALDEKEGGFPNLLSLRQALHEVLKSRGRSKELSKGYMSGFRSSRPRINYEKNIDEAVEAETGFQRRLRNFDFRKEFPLLADLLKDAWRQLDWRKMWPFYAAPYLLFMTPVVLSVHIRSFEDLLWVAILILVSIPCYIGFVMAFSHVRRPID
jgi:hypothetical protein